MSLLDDLVTAIEDYPHTDLTLEIIEVDPEGDSINVGETGTFTVQVTNSGALTVRNLVLTATGRSGVEVAGAGAGQPFAHTALSNTFDVLPGHQPGQPIRMPGSRMRFSAPGRAKAETDLIEVSVESWDTDFDHMTGAHSKEDAAAKGVYRAEVLPPS
ncbi:DUF11 domain-containing protein [Occultella kanbiaonis]|uniref:DUF11 domain-containing protein n=1 Tax=Occultella kanbiaonis TaxID=2675754 RepID=UPI0012B91D9A|nr:DUF11 domain-containing protein [Occultella kanbiaonis]